MACNEVEEVFKKEIRGDEGSTAYELFCYVTEVYRRNGVEVFQGSPGVFVATKRVKHEDKKNSAKNNKR